MKIAFIGQKGIPARIGGVERYTEEIAKRLAQRGHEVFVYARKNYTDSSIREYKGVKIIHLPSVSTKHLDAITHTLFSVLHAIFREYDVVHFNSIGPTFLSFLIKLFKRRTALVATYHCQDYFHKKWSVFARFSLRLGELATVFVPDKTIAVSKILGRYIFAKFKKQVEVITNGMDVSPAKESDYLKKWNLSKNGYILFVGRMIRHKGVHYLIEAYKNLEDKHLIREKKLVIVGEGFHTDQYVQEIKDMARGRENIIFTGALEGDALRQIFSHAYLFVQPSESEGLSIALLEAMGYGKAILSSDIPENKEPLGEESAFFFRSGNIFDLEEKLVRLINSPLEIKTRGEKALEKATAYFSWENIVSSLEKTYLEALEKKVGRKKIVFKSNERNA